MPLIYGNLDFIALDETKSDHSFPIAYVAYTGYKKPNRLDITSKKRGHQASVKTDILSRQVTSTEIPSDIQLLVNKLNFKKQKWLAICVYKSPFQNN